MLRKSFRYNGFLSLNERWADNRDLWTKFAKNPELAAAFVVSPKEAKRKLDLLERFSVSEIHERLVAHKVEIYQYDSPSWKRIGKSEKRGNCVNPKGELYTPNGERNLVAQADLGLELIRLSGKPAYKEEVLEYFVQHKLPDGTEIQGRKVRKTLLTSSDVGTLNSYLDLSFDLMPTALHLPSYGFEVDTQKLSREAPFETLVTSYVTVDGQIVSEEKERVIPVLKVMREKENFELRYSRS